MLALVIDPVRKDLNITEVEIALLQGFAFSIFYVTIGIPLGAVADRVNRRRLLIVGIVVWSLATMAGGLADSFGAMFASRLFIGVGEAVLAPCAVTMISDLFPVTGRGRPMAIYVFGSMIAYGIGSLVSGLILEAAPRGAFDAVPFLADRAAWRVCFLLIGMSGFAVALLLLLAREPPRCEQAAAVVTPGSAGGPTRLRFFIDNRRLLLPFYAALATFAMGASVATSWGAVQLTRVFGFTVGEAGQALGASQIAWSAAGALLASVVVDAVARRGGTAGKLRLAATITLLAIPSSSALFAGSGGLAAAMIGELMFVSAIFGTTMLSVVAEIAPPQVRGLAVALYAFVMTMIGMSLGPLAVAFLTEHVFADPARIGHSMAIVGTAALSCSALLAFAAARRLDPKLDA